MQPNRQFATAANFKDQDVDSFLEGLDEYAEEQKRNATVDEKKKSKAQPVYYKKDIVPQKVVHEKERLEIKQAFIQTLTGRYTPLQVQTDLFMKPLPVDIGMLQCEIERNTSGFNKFWPKYTLSLTENRVDLLNSKKIANSKTSHYKINLSNCENKYK